MLLLDFYLGKSKEKFNEKFNNLLYKWSGLPQNIIEKKQIKITVNESIHTIEVKEEAAPKNRLNIVMIHGYGGSGIIFYKLFKYLFRNLNIYSIDIRGQGLCEKSKKTKLKTREEAENFFIEGIEKWREKQKLDNIILLGHSLGGYISALYAQKYPSKVSHLILISPAGINPCPANQKQIYADFKKGLPFYKKIIISFIKFFWQHNLNPYSLMYFFGKPLAYPLISEHIKSRFVKMNFIEEELNDFIELMYQVLLLPTGSMNTLGKILEVGTYGKYALRQRIKEFKMPVTFIQGKVKELPDRDTWIQWLQELKCKKINQYMFVNSGHQCYLDYPEEISNLILKDLGIKPNYPTNQENELIYIVNSFTNI